MIYTNKKVSELKSEVGRTFFLNPKNNMPIKAEECIFLDIETVANYDDYNKLSPELQKRFELKLDRWTNYDESAKSKIIDAFFHELEKESNITDINPETLLKIYKNQRTESPAARYREIAGLYPEYAKIICISLGFKKNGEFQTISFVGDELELLMNFQFGINKLYERISKENNGNVWVVGHNINFFDIPFITKRMSLNGLITPYFLHQPFQQPWNKKVIDTASEWRAGNATGDATLDTIALNLGFESSKQGAVNGESMGKYYYSDKFDIKELVSYCESDVTTVYNLFNYLQNLKQVI
ncbi:MAG: hypothetical protein RLZZ86_4120 [Cyanobacteriota bacterium]|jgi:hypothetical protein